MLVGVISDTHGLLREQACAALRGADLIVHAGDVGSLDVLERLRRIAAVRAVRGNTDTGGWAAQLPVTDLVDLGPGSLLLVHDLGGLDAHPWTLGASAVVSGHTHRPHQYTEGGCLFFNPGSAGPRRGGLPITVGRLWVSGAQIRPEVVKLEVGCHV